MKNFHVWCGGALLFFASSVMAQATSGELALPALVKNSCAYCHSFNKGGPNGQGPNLYGLIGQKAGSVPGFAYSPAFKKALTGKVWTKELLDAWLTDTQQVAPGSLMTYFLDDAKYRGQIVDYLTGEKGK
ncbi:c-type cytochrome [Noviherbaspirillum sedimenti]|uniref:Cytochrome C n=1 Tax=Noviherbaspirillum sedimenti TaxID=2320865 RepID=A0A3A3G1V4_9BURK|nr:cytochrome C [Noviherbaspirillum sedimenti]RJG02478.1 cytochrome C [Noviherbaspirillum sedimenti]